MVVNGEGGPGAYGIVEVLAITIVIYKTLAARFTYDRHYNWGCCPRVVCRRAMAPWLGMLVYSLSGVGAEALRGTLLATVGLFGSQAILKNDITENVSLCCMKSVQQGWYIQ